MNKLALSSKLLAMPLHHQGYRSDISLLRQDGAVCEERERYWVVRFPRHPDFIWGNFLLLKEPPLGRDFPLWMDASKRELGSTWFMAIGWEGWLSHAHELEPYTSFGFEFEQSDVLICTEATKPAKYSEVVISPCRDDADWDRLLEAHIFLFARGRYKDSQVDFFTKRYASFRRLVESERGEFFEARLGDEIVGSFGLFHDSEVARFQEVVVYPRFRNMGLAQSMCYEGLRWAFENWKLARVMTVANLPEALHCYRNLGFQSIEIQEGLRWIDPLKFPRET